MSIKLLALPRASEREREREEREREREREREKREREKRERERGAYIHTHTVYSLLLFLPDPTRHIYDLKLVAQRAQS